MNEYVFLFRGAAPSSTPAEAQAQLQKWSTWIKALAEKGFLVSPGNPLERSGKLVSGREKTVTDGPFAEKDIVGGYTLIKADDLSHAVELSRGCPIFEYGGAVEVRPVMKMNL